MSKRKIKAKKTSKKLEQKVAKLIVEGKDIDQILEILNVDIFELMGVLKSLKIKADILSKSLH